MVERTTTVRRAMPGGKKTNPGQRWLAMLAALVMVAGLAHVWLHYSGAVDADHFSERVVDDCLLCELPLVAATAVSTGPVLPVLFIAAGTARPVPAVPDHRRPPARAPPRS